MSIVNMTTRRDTSMDNSEDMSFTRNFKGASDDSVDMSVTNMHIPIPNEESDVDISATQKAREYNTTVNNFVVNYDDDVSQTMHIGGAAAKDEKTKPEYNANVNNFVMNYDDDVSQTMQIGGSAAKDEKFKKQVNNFVMNYDDDVQE